MIKHGDGCENYPDGIRTSKSMITEVEDLFEDIQNLLGDVHCTDNPADKLQFVNSAIEKANRLVELVPENADAHLIM